MCWMAVGTVSKPFLGACTGVYTQSQAVRLGYMMGLEQLVMQPDDIEERSVDDRARGKVVWSCKSISSKLLIIFCC